MGNNLTQTSEEVIKILKFERPLFEENYVECGGRLQYLKWEECSDGTGSYVADWEAINAANISDVEFNEDIQEHADHVTGCLNAWVQCAMSKAIPGGYRLLPLLPNEEMLCEAEKEFDDVDCDDLQDRIVFAHQAMCRQFALSDQVFEDSEGELVQLPVLHRRPDVA